MIPVIHANTFSLSRFQLPGDDSQVSKSVKEILNSVRREGDTALAHWTRQFDSSDFDISDIPLDFQNPEAKKLVKPALFEILTESARNIEIFSQQQLPRSWQKKGALGEIVGERYLPMERVGIYIPGGKAPYPSTVLMTAIPARVAGVKEIVLVTPPGPDKTVHPAILAAAQIAGVTEAYRVGGAQSIAALAYGTATIRPVDKIVGPGNVFVQIAKKAVFGQVGIDSLAGPSEVVVLADETANPDFVAWEILAQAEHDERARSILVTNSDSLVEAVQTLVQKQVKKLARKAILEVSLTEASQIILFEGAIEEGIRLVNQIAPEHVSVQTQNAIEVAQKITHAGAVFVGAYSPVALGDYWAGPSHVLPTSGTARFSSPLGVLEFLKRSSWIAYSQEKLQKEADKIARFAETEGLTAHAKSVEIRKKNINPGKK
ncbi:MAG: histidinol dehydrogenase [Calditrichaeota bacterium]|nr:histidinol dehydrogenase [Calditrichota bacterium]